MYNDGTVQVVDPETHTVLDTIYDVGHFPLQDQLPAPPDLGIPRLPDLGLPVIPLPVPNLGPHPIVLRTVPDHSKIYVGNFGPVVSQIGVIDTATNKVVKRIDTLGPAYAVQTISHDGRYLYVPTGASVVQVIDTETDAVVRTLPIPIAPIHLEVSADDKALYMFTSVGTVAQFDAQTGAPLGPQILLEGAAPGWGAISGDGNTLYAINFLTSNITWIDTREWRVVKNVALPFASTPLSATLTRDDSEIWVCNVVTNDITILDARTGEQLRTIKTRNAPAYVGFSSDGSTAYVSDLGDFTANDPILMALKLNFYSLPPGGTGYLDTYDTTTLAHTGRTAVGGYPVAGIYP